MLINVVKRHRGKKSIKSNGIYKTRFILLAVATERVKGHTVWLLSEEAKLSSFL